MFEAFIPAAFFHFCTHFTETFSKLKKFVWVFYAIAIPYSIGMLTPLMITGVDNVLFFKFWPVPGPLLLSHVVYFGIVVVSGVGLLIHRCILTSGAERQRALWVTAAHIVGFGGGSINWFLWFGIPIPPLTNFFVGIMFAMVGYAIVRHGLMDVDAIVEILRSSRASSLGLLASSMNHELRNPLFIAKGKIETQIDAIERGLYSSPEEEAFKSREVFANALHQLSRAMDIMQKFSQFVRPQVLPAEKECVKVGEVIRDVKAMIFSEFEIRKITIDDSGVNGAIVHANRRQLEEVLFNLMVNACQAMEKDGGNLTIKARHSQRSVNIEVSDTGPGIPKSNQPRIFDPFYSTKAKKGTGLGLYIAKQLVERNDGKIELKSEPGRGAVFSIQFKAAEK